MNSGNPIIIKNQIINIIVYPTPCLMRFPNQNRYLFQITAAVQYQSSIVFHTNRITVFHLNKIRGISLIKELLSEMLHTITGGKRNFLSHKQNFLFVNWQIFYLQRLNRKFCYFLHDSFRICIGKNQPFLVMLHPLHWSTNRKYSKRHPHGHHLGSRIGKGLRPDRWY